MAINRGTLNDVDFDMLELSLKYTMRTYDYGKDDFVPGSVFPGSKWGIEQNSQVALVVHEQLQEDTTSLHVSFRGTVRSIFDNVVTDLEAVPVYNDVLGLKLHAGFNSAGTALFELVQQLATLSKYSHICLSGHSLGGAVAMVVGMLMWTIPNRQFELEIHTFGSPMVTDTEGATKFADLPAIRTIHYRDPIPLMPPRDIFGLVMEYAHVGREVFLLNNRGENVGFATQQQSNTQFCPRYGDRLADDFVTLVVKDRTSAIVRALPVLINLAKHMVASYKVALDAVAARINADDESKSTNAEGQNQVHKFKNQIQDERQQDETKSDTGDSTVCMYSDMSGQRCGACSDSSCFGGYQPFACENFMMREESFDMGSSEACLAYVDATTKDASLTRSVIQDVDVGVPRLAYALIMLTFSNKSQQAESEASNDECDYRAAMTSAAAVKRCVEIKIRTMSEKKLAKLVCEKASGGTKTGPVCKFLSGIAMQVMEKFWDTDIGKKALPLVDKVEHFAESAAKRLGTWFISLW
jgi:hypothetical protein